MLMVIVASFISFVFAQNANAPGVSITQPNGFRGYNSNDSLIIVWSIKAGTSTAGTISFQINDANLGQNKVTPIQNGMLGSAPLSALTATFRIPDGIPAGDKYTVVGTVDVINMFYSPNFPINQGKAAPPADSPGSGENNAAPVTTSKSNAAANCLNMAAGFVAMVVCPVL